MAIASVDDVRVSLRRDLDDEEHEWASALLDRAERLLIDRVPGLLARVHGDRTERYRDTVADVEAEMVARVLRAPHGGVYLSETVGQVSSRANLQVASGLLDVLDAELARLGVGGWQVITPDPTHDSTGYDPRRPHGPSESLIWW